MKKYLTFKHAIFAINEFYRRFQDQVKSHSA